MPNPLWQLPYHWIPLGLIEDDVKMEVVAHLCNSAKARWDAYDPQHATIYEQAPGHIAEFIESLQLTVERNGANPRTKAIGHSGVGTAKVLVSARADS